MNIRPTIRALLGHLEKEHGLTWERRPIVRGADNEDGPQLIVAKRGTASALIPQEADDVLTSTLFESICRRLGLKPEDVHVECENGEKVTVMEPEGTPSIN